MYERGMRVRLRDRRWEVEEVRAAGTHAVLDLRLADERPEPPRLTVVSSLEPDLVPEAPARLRFGLGTRCCWPSCTTRWHSRWRTAAATWSPPSTAASRWSTTS
jgi:hypothetical protein